jgi:hypothetical protein
MILPAGISTRSKSHIDRAGQSVFKRNNAARHVVKLASIEFAAVALDLVGLVVLISLGKAVSLT